MPNSERNWLPLKLILEATSRNADRPERGGPTITHPKRPHTNQPKYAGYHLNLHTPAKGYSHIFVHPVQQYPGTVHRNSKPSAKTVVFVKPTLEEMVSCGADSKPSCVCVPSRVRCPSVIASPQTCPIRPVSWVPAFGT